MDRLHTKTVWMVAGATALVMALGGCKRTDNTTGTGTGTTGSTTGTTGGGMTGSTGTTSGGDMGASGAASAASR